MISLAPRSVLLSVLIYDRKTGHFFWRVNVSPSGRAGMRAGTVSPDGYVLITFKRRKYPAHWIAWLFEYGRWPKMLDHRDCDKANNAIANLREATPTQNNANRIFSRSGTKGATLHKSGKYQAQIKFAGKNFYLGLFDSEQGAGAAYAAKAKELFGEFARHDV